MFAKNRFNHFVVTAMILVFVALFSVSGRVEAQGQGVNLTQFLKQVVYPTFNSYSFTNTTGGGAILFDRTFTCGTVLNVTWLSPSAGHTGKIFVRAIGGVLHVQSELQYRPIVLEGYRSPLEKQYNFDVDGTLSEYDRGYFARLNRWASYRCLDLEYQLRTNKEFSRLYARFLRQAGGAKKFSQELRAMGFESDGFPVEEGSLDDMNEALDLLPNGDLDLIVLRPLSNTGDPDLDSYLNNYRYPATMATEAQAFYNEFGAVCTADIEGVPTYSEVCAADTPLSVSIIAIAATLVSSVGLFLVFYAFLFPKHKFTANGAPGVRTSRDVKQSSGSKSERKRPQC